MKKYAIATIVTILVGSIIYYFLLPPINLSSSQFWLYFIFMIIVFLATFFYFDIEVITKKKQDYFKLNKYNISILCILSIVVIIFILNIIVCPLFNADSYHNRISVDEESDFVSDVALVDFSKIPLLDKESSEKLGDRKMGQATDWVSQFYVSDLYTQINYNDRILRVTPIEYAGLIKYFTNNKEGIKGYITVDSVNGEAKLVKLDKGIKYVPSAYFFEDLQRKLRFSYPTKIFDEASFEIDNEGNPYWIIPTIKYTMVNMRKEIDQVIILNAQTGESKIYDLEDVPTWVDHVYSADLIIEQLNDWGRYTNGFINSIFGQKNVVNTTEGYNYLVMNDDVYLYTGITSVSTDESNLGFVLVNMRTKKTNFYAAPGAEEYSAMASAEGLVQEKKYVASFPLLINLNNKPTYLLSLKDAAGLVKMYAFVDVEDYQKVVVNDASLGIEAAAKKYLGENKDIKDESTITSASITVNNITSTVEDGYTIYYFKDEENNMYKVNIKVSSTLPFIKNNDKLNIKYYDGEVREIIEVG